MCLFKKSIVNPYTRRSQVVSCGHCPACLQEKAQGRKRRIDYTGKKGTLWFFITLTYANSYVPFVLIKDLKNDKLDKLPIYRRKSRRFVREDDNYNLRDSVSINKQPIDYMELEKGFREKYSLQYIPHLRKKSGCLGVCYYKDLQDFVKRLRINLQRDYGITEKFDFYGCSEYGETTFRPHFHVLVNAPAKYEKQFERSTYKSWRFDNTLPRKFEVAINASGYVSSYVNGSADIPKFLTSKSFRQKHSYSQGFGMDLFDFDFHNIVRLAQENDVTYNLQVTIKGKPTKCNLPIPKYVISRYFPQFKGYSRITNFALPNLLKSALEDKPLAFYNKAYNIFKEYGVDNYFNHNIKVDYEPTRKRLRNAYERLNEKYGVSSNDYIRYYIEVWQAYRNTILRKFYENEHNVQQLELYDNLNDLLKLRVQNETLMELLAEKAEFLGDYRLINFDCNNFNDNVQRSLYYEDLYYKKKKRRKIINYALVEQGYNY